MNSNKQQEKRYARFRKFSKMLINIFPKIIFSKMSPYVSWFFKVSWSLQRQIKMVLGPCDGLKH